MERSFRSAQTASISLNSVELSEFTSFNFLKILVLTSVRTASTYLSSLMLVKNKVRSFRSAQTASISLNSVELSEFTSLRDIEKATGFGGSYREIIMKKF